MSGLPALFDCNSNMGFLISFGSVVGIGQCRWHSLGGLIIAIRMKHLSAEGQAVLMVPNTPRPCAHLTF